MLLNRKLSSIAGEKELADRAPLEPGKVRALRHMHYCPVCNNYWVHKVQHYSCTLCNSAGIEWFIAIECQRCVRIMKERQLCELRMNFAENERTALT